MNTEEELLIKRVFKELSRIERIALYNDIYSTDLTDNSFVNHSIEGAILQKAINDGKIQIIIDCLVTKDI